MKKSTQQILAFAFGVVFISVMLAIAVLMKHPSSFQYLVFRVVLSLAAAGIAAMLPGFLTVAVPNWLKAGGAFAMFVLVFYTNPASLVVELPEAKVSLSQPAKIDLRTDQSGGSFEERMNGKIFLTVPYEYKSTLQPAKTITVDNEVASMRLDERVYEFESRWFVNQNPENKGKWLGIDTEAKPVSIPSGESRYHETGLITSTGTSWGDFVKLMKNSKDDHLYFEISSQSSPPEGAVITLFTECKASLKLVKQADPSALIHKATLPCV